MNLLEPLIAFDQFINCFIYIKGDGWGFADETLSARLFRCHLQKIISEWPYRIVDMLLFFDKNHCSNSWSSEVHRKQLPNFYSKD